MKTKYSYVIIKDAYHENMELHAVASKQIICKRPTADAVDSIERQVVINALKHMEKIKLDTISVFDPTNKLLVIKVDQSTYTFSQLVNDISTHFEYDKYYLYARWIETPATIDDMLSIMNNKENMTGPFKITNDE